jgi:hypothetical protein
MSSSLLSLFGLSAAEQENVANTIGRVKTVSGYASDLIDAVSKTDLPGPAMDEADDQLLFQRRRRAPWLRVSAQVLPGVSVR